VTHWEASVATGPVDAHAGTAPASLSLVPGAFRCESPSISAQTHRLPRPLLCGWYFSW